MEKMIHNPVLKGFNPDPSILRVEDDYYIATSTFQWFPGVQIHHSRDLRHWELLCRPLDNSELLDMIGIPDSGGVWAPCLSYDNGTYYLVYSIVRTFTNYYKDVDNYLITSKDIKGPWTSPVYLNSSGFDPSLFHDVDGRKYLVNQLFNHRTKENQKKQFLGIVLQEYSVNEQKLIGKPQIIFEGSELGVTEGPHIYKIDGYYYLLCAEGGTFYEHAATLARAENIGGPYEISPYTPLITSYNHPELILQKSGHASIVETQDGEYYLAHLCGRPNGNNQRCMLGRETSLQKLRKTKDGWLVLEEGNIPKEKVPAPDLEEWFVKSKEKRCYFENGLPIEFQTLRIPLESEWIRFDQTRDSMVLAGRNSMESPFFQSLVGRRREDFDFVAETCLSFEPDTFQQMAGMALYYDTSDYVYLNITTDEKKGKVLTLLECNQKKIMKIGESVIMESQKPVYMRMEVKNAKAIFKWSIDGQVFFEIGNEMDVTHLSDDYYNERINGVRFTGTFIALCCQDISGRRKEAEFYYLDYEGYDK